MHDLGLASYGWGRTGLQLGLPFPPTFRLDPPSAISLLAAPPPMEDPSQWDLQNVQLEP